MRPLDLEADLRFDGPVGPGRVTADEDGVVIRVSGWGRLLHLAYRSWRRPPAGLPTSPLGILRAVARATHRPVYVDAGFGPRIRIASPPRPPGPLTAQRR